MNLYTFIMEFERKIGIFAYTLRECILSLSTDLNSIWNLIISLESTGYGSFDFDIGSWFRARRPGLTNVDLL